MAAVLFLRGKDGSTGKDLRIGNPKNVCHGGNAAFFNDCHKGAGLGG